MATVNLLPWRAEIRKERQRQFIGILGCTILCAIAVLVLRNHMIKISIENQTARNQMIRLAITEIDGKIGQIGEFKETKSQLLQRIEVIHNLQGNRSSIVRVFDELARSTPEGLYFTHLSMAGKGLNLQGVAESNSDISKLMRRLDDSTSFTEPNLTAVKAKPTGEGSLFDLSVSRTQRGGV